MPEGGTTTFTVATAGNPAPTIKWQALAPGTTTWADLADTTPFNSSPYTGTRTATLTLTGATRALDTTRYRAIVTNDYGQATSGEATLTVEFPPTIAAQPADRTVAAGEATTFTVSASAAAPATYRWQIATPTTPTWTDIANGGVYAGTGTATLSLTAVPATLHRAQYRVIIANAFGTATSSMGTLTVFGPLTSAPTALRFAATKAGTSGALTTVTAPQSLTLGTSGAATAWTASADRPWVQLSTTSGVGADLLTVSIANPGNVLGGSTSATSLVTLTPTTSGLAPVIVTVSLAINHSAVDSTAPYGQVDTPAQDASDIAGAVAVTGWALDDVGVASVGVYRTCLAFDPAVVCQMIDGQSVVYVGDAAFLPGARPDVESAFVEAPAANRAGWGLLVLTPMLPHVPAGQPRGGHGPLAFHVLATDLAGNRTWLGRAQGDRTPTRVLLANDALAKPFGTIDTPAQGATVSGVLHNFGWALTPDADTISDSTDRVIPPTGSTMVVFLDGQPVGLVAYNQCRGTVGNPVPSGLYCDDDVANLFGTVTAQTVGAVRTSNPTRHRNLDVGRGAIGVYAIDTTTLTNGVHTIAWSVTDSANRTEGIGSRFFTVLNGASRAAPASHQDAAPSEAAHRPVAQVPVLARVGFDLQTPWQAVDPDAAGVRVVRLPELGRLELAVDAAFTGAYLQVGDRLDPLPLGASFSAGVFTWTPVAGYVGTYELVFVSPDGRVPVSVRVER